MDAFSYDYSIIGGDLRQVYLSQKLAEADNNVCHYCLCRSVKGIDSAASFDPKHIVSLPSLEAACHSASSIVCPIPFSKDGVFLNQTSSKKKITLKQILALLKRGQRFYAGSIPEEFCQEAAKKGVDTFDFMQDVDLSYFNTIATAEGILCEAISLSPQNLHGSKCAVLGYGKCALTLTELLKRMFCFVSVVSSPKEELARAALIADQTIRLFAFSEHIAEYDFIFNTIPAITLTKRLLSRVKPNAVILDLASSPGGVDFAAAKELSVQAVSCPGLPGKYAPLSSAEAIQTSIQTFERSSLCL